ENGLQNFDADGVQQITDAVDQANADTSFAGQDAAAAAALATDTAAGDPVVRQVIDTNKVTPTPTPTPTPSNQSHQFALKLLGNGPTGTDPASGIRVLRHDVSGAVVADMFTDADGVADFGDVGTERATFSIVTEDRLFTFVDVPVGSFSGTNPL